MISTTDLAAVLKRLNDEEEFPMCANSACRECGLVRFAEAREQLDPPIYRYVCLNCGVFFNS